MKHNFGVGLVLAEDPADEFESPLDFDLGKQVVSKWLVFLSLFDDKSDEHEIGDFGVGEIDEKVSDFHAERLLLIMRGII